jgi:catechol 2,3-dioxygenase-like lactoylglutathione lyase family enzyme
MSVKRNVTVPVGRARVTRYSSAAQAALSTQPRHNARITHEKGFDDVLADAMLVTTVAVTDLDRARQFFGEQLGLPLLDETPFALRFGAGNGTQVSVRRGQPNVGQTVGHFEVADIEATVRDLLSRDVPFDEYETPKTTNFIAQIGPARAAWFKDPDGNVFGLREGPIPGAG